MKNRRSRQRAVGSWQLAKNFKFLIDNREQRTESAAAGAVAVDSWQSAMGSRQKTLDSELTTEN